MTAGLTRKPDVRALNAIVRFVLDRLDDEDRLLRQRIRRRTAEDGSAWDARSAMEIDCAREIVGVVQRQALLRDMPSEQPVRDAAMDVLRSLARPYADHRRYLPEWQ